MVTVEKALEIIASVCSELPAEKRALAKAFDHVLAENVFSPVDMPPFRQSAMDGYALHMEPGTQRYTLKGEIRAGSGLVPELKKGEAIRIFTGAAVPDTANAVVQQELVTRSGAEIIVDAVIHPGTNIRPAGEQIKKGQVALPERTGLNPAAVGYLASIGIAEVEVISKPKIAILTTGDELVEPGSDLEYGQVYESNSSMLAVALTNFQFEKPTLVKVPDDAAKTQNELEKLIRDFDVILVSGGISVGDYDFVKSSLEHLGVKEQFYKISQKPGKPLYFGTANKKLVFALPGNPASALTCFYVYVLPALNKISGKGFDGLKTTCVMLKGSYTKKRGMAHFLKSKLEGREAIVLESQSSAMLNTFATADSMIYVPAETESLVPGSPVTVYLLE